MDVPGYRGLKVWVKAHENAVRAVGIIEELSARHDCIAKQFLSSITSVGANIAEGSGGYHNKEFVRFLNIALRSAFETDNWIQILKDSGLIVKSNLSSLENQNLEVIKMLIGLIKKMCKE